jgi:hypothetical protein
MKVIPLLVDEAGTVGVGKINIGGYGVKGWTLEEILRDVMGLRDTESLDYQTAMREFDNAIDSERAADVK